MSHLRELFDALPNLLPALAAAAFVAVLLWFAYWLLLRRHPDLGIEDRTPRQVAMLLIAIMGFLAVLLALPMSTETRSHLVSLVGVLLTAVIALSSTTFVSNAMAGFMLRIVHSYKPGDFVRVGEHFGRITERGLFHTEIQTADRDLTTLPNLYLVTNPITVIRSSGTIVSASLSLGYDVSRTVAEPLLLAAAEDAELGEPFVQVTDLGDFSVTYRVAGFLSDAKRLLTTRSTLRKCILDSLHGAGVEIVSPAFMNQRVLDKDKPVIPQTCDLNTKSSEASPDTPEQRIFDKADMVEQIEQLRTEHAKRLAEIKEMEAELTGASESAKATLARRIEAKQKTAQIIADQIAEAEKQRDEPE